MLFIKVLYSIWFYALFIICTFIGILVYALSSLFPKHSLKICVTYNRAWATFFMLFAGQRFEIEQPDLAKRKQAYIIVSNHTSNYDAFILSYGLRLAYRPLAKKELGKIPFFGWLVKKVSIMVDRSNKASRDMSFESMTAALGKGESLLIFAEGTRNKTEDILQPFKSGAFRLAEQTGVPILPVIITGAKQGIDLKTQLAWPVKAKLTYLNPMVFSKEHDNNAESFKDKVRNQMLAVLLKEN